MAIADYKPETAEVKFKGGSLIVRGLALDDLAILMRTHLSDLDSLVAMFKGDVENEIAVSAMAQYAITLVKEAPGLVANLIALACDDGDNVDAYRKLSIPKQFESVEAIGRLTFEEAGGPKKFIENLMRLFRGMTPPTKLAGSRT